MVGLAGQRMMITGGVSSDSTSSMVRVSALLIRPVPSSVVCDMDLDALAVGVKALGWCANTAQGRLSHPPRGEIMCASARADNFAAITASRSAAAC
jgi:hypothetical protein